MLLDKFRFKGMVPFFTFTVKESDLKSIDKFCGNFSSETVPILATSILANSTNFISLNIPMFFLENLRVNPAHIKPSLGIQDTKHLLG